VGIGSVDFPVWPQRMTREKAAMIAIDEWTNASAHQWDGTAYRSVLSLRKQQ
jgi:hypothetical protein